jgi:hypothetical protein
MYLGVGMAGSPVIGTAMTKGPFRVDNATVSGNATLFEGSILETATASSSVQLSSGARFLLGADSRGRLFGDRLVLEKGATNLENGPGFHLVALGLTIQPDRGTSAALVSFDGTRRVRVVSSRGGLRVLNSSGQVIANLAPGTALAFEPQAVSSEITRVTGKLENLSGHYVLVDEVTHIVVEVVGPGVAKEVGNRVEIFGAADRAATPISDATQLIRVRELRSLGKAEVVAEAAGTGKGPANAKKGPPKTTADAGNTVPGAAKSGAPPRIATARTVSLGSVAVVGGVVVAAVFGGLAVADVASSQNPVSR